MRDSTWLILAGAAVVGYWLINNQPKSTTSVTTTPALPPSTTIIGPDVLGVEATVSMGRLTPQGFAAGACPPGAMCGDDPAGGTMPWYVWALIAVGALTFLIPQGKAR